MFLFDRNQFGHRLVKYLVTWTTWKRGIDWRSWNNNWNICWTFQSSLIGNTWLGIGFKVRRMVRRLISVLKLGFSLINLRRNDISLSSIRKIRANHLGSDLRPGAEAQLANHAVQVSQQQLVLQLQGSRPQLRTFHPFLQGVNISPLSVNSTKELTLGAEGVLPRG